MGYPTDEEFERAREHRTPPAQRQASPLPTGAMADAVDCIVAERRRQNVLKAEGRFKYTCADVGLSDGERYLILSEEVGEVARAVMENHGLANDKHNVDLKKEITQCAAICLAWLEGLEADEKLR